MTVKIVARDGCPYCDNARAWFKNKNIPFELTLVNEMWDRQRFYDNTSRQLGKQVSTVPQIWIDGKHIGGWSDLQQTSYFNERN